MSEVTVQYLLQSTRNSATMEAAAADTVEVSRADLDKEHSLLLARIHQIRRLLGYPPLMTGKEIERQARK